MTNNDLLRRLRYALKLNGETIAEICRLAGYEIGPIEVLKLLKKEDEHGFTVCDDIVMNAFLDGLITHKRGRREAGPAPVPVSGGLTNNIILRKLRIALELNDEKMIEIFLQAGVTISKPELSALFRAVDHRNYKVCGDQLLRNFVQGLTLGQKTGAGNHK
jgi:uncharacterized protein YehS (DUF1456 family)